MQKAYDTFLQSEVSADLAAKSGGREPYRYECAHCGEEVHLAAVDSTSMVPHFRHLSGNNNVECEDYLGQYGAINTDSRSRKSKNERVEFYSDNITKMFYLGLRFSDNEIALYEKSSTTFELRQSVQEQAFFTLGINNRNFDPDVPRMIPLETFSNNYFLSNTLNGVKRKYVVFKNNGGSVPTFFKMQGNDSDCKAKLVRSAVLYTNVPYFVAFQSQYSFPGEFSFPSGIEVNETFQFETMGRKFLGKVLTIKAKTVNIDSLMISWGYQLDVSETLTLMWPPAALLNEVLMIDSNSAFLFSSFELHAHGNINVHSENIKKITCSISKVLVNSKVKVYRKNAEIVIDKGERYSSSLNVLSIVHKHDRIYTIPDDSVHFLFCRSGVISLCNGQSVPLTPGSVIKHYSFGYLDGLVYQLQQSKLTGEQLLCDILAHYKRTETFSMESFSLFGLSGIASKYIEACSESGLINSSVKRFIEEGLI